MKYVPDFLFEGIDSILTFQSTHLNGLMQKNIGFVEEVAEKD